MFSNANKSIYNKTKTWTLELIPTACTIYNRDSVGVQSITFRKL